MAKAEHHLESATNGPTQAMENRALRVSRTVCSGSASKRSRIGRSPCPALVEDRSSPGAQSRYASALIRPPGTSKACSMTSTIRTAGCGPARPVVWEGRSGKFRCPLCRLFLIGH